MARATNAEQDAYFRSGPDFDAIADDESQASTRDADERRADEDSVRYFDRESGECIGPHVPSSDHFLATCIHCHYPIN